MNAPVISFSRRLRVSPFELRSLEGSKSASVYNHLVLPTCYESLEADYWHLREHVQLWDVACQVQVEVQGPDAAEFVEYLTPRDVSRCQVGQCIYTPLIDEAAGIINDPLVLRLAEDRFWISLSDSDVLLWAKGLALGKGFDVRVFDPDVFPMSIQGPKSADLLSRVLGDSIRELKFFRFVETEIAGTPVVVARTGWSGQGGYEIYLQEPDAGVTLWDTLAAAGEDLQVRAGCPNLIERIESGLLSFGNDMTLANNPLEAGLDRFFKLGKSADYLGRAALEAIAEEGVKNRLVKLVIEGEPISNPRTVYTVQGESGENIGTVTSAVYSPRLCCNIGLGYLPVSYCDEGKAAIVLTPQGPRALRIANNDWSS